MAEALSDKDQRVEELERQLAGLRGRLEKLGGEVVRADYKVLHLTQEVRRSREAFGFLTGFQNSISRARSIDVLYGIALKSIISELWMKRAVLLERGSAGDTMVPASHLGYPTDASPGSFELQHEARGGWSRPQLVNGATAPEDWIAAVRSALGIPYFLWIPATRNGIVETVLVAGTLVEDAAQEPRLIGHDLDLFVSVGAILHVGQMNLLARERLKRQVVYQSLLHKVSSVLLRDFDTPTAHFGDVIARVGATWSLDRVRLLTRRTDERMAAIAHQWTADGVAPAADAAYPLEEVPRWRDAMAEGATVRIDGVDALPDLDAAPLRGDGIRSVLLVPVTVHRSVVGWASFEQCASTRTWTPEDTQLLEVITGLIAGAVAREREMDERAQLEAEFHHSKKMEAVGQLAGGVAHDFNNLLTTIQGYAQLLTARLPEEYRDLPGLKEIIMASEKAAGLTRQLLSFSRRDTASTGAVTLNTLIADTMKLLSRMLGDKIEVDLDLSTDLSTIVGDSQQLSQVIMNLALNARDAMDKGGRLTVTTRELPVAGALGRRFSIPGIERCQVIEVSDSGHGMDEETKERIFEPFFTTKPAGSGTGLGLSIVFSAVRRHGGFVDVTSAPGEGTTFSVYLPVRTPDIAVDDEPRPVQGAVGHETILVVEDDDGVRTMICEVLESQGYEVVAVSNGREALEELAHSSEHVSLVMTDIVMPELGGRDVWREIQARGLSIPIIVMSGYPQGKDMDDLMKGAATYLQKPFGPKEISRAVRHTLDSAEKRKERGEPAPLR